MADHLRAGGPYGTDQMVDIPTGTVGRKFIENLGVLSALGLEDARQRDCGSCVCFRCGTTPAQQRQRVVEGAQAEGITGYFRRGTESSVNADLAPAIASGKEAKRKCGRGGEIVAHRQDGRLYEAGVCGIPEAGRKRCANLQPARRLIHINAQRSCRWSTPSMWPTSTTTQITPMPQQGSNSTLLNSNDGLARHSASQQH